MHPVCFAAAQIALAANVVLAGAPANEQGNKTEGKTKEGAVDIGDRLELFVDEHLVDRLEGDARLHLHTPKGREVVLTHDKAWEDSSMAYFAAFLDGDLYRMYYRSFHHGTGEEAHGEPMCYAESKNGILWIFKE